MKRNIYLMYAIGFLQGMDDIEAMRKSGPGATLISGRMGHSIFASLYQRKGRIFITSLHKRTSFAFDKGIVTLHFIKSYLIFFYERNMRK